MKTFRYKLAASKILKKRCKLFRQRILEQIQWFFRKKHLLPKCMLCGTENIKVYKSIIMKLNEITIYFSKSIRQKNSSN